MSSAKTLWRLSFHAPIEDEEAITEQLFAITNSYPAVRLRPRARMARFESFFTSCARLRRVKKLLAYRSPQVSELAYENWAESWKKHFPVQRVGNHIVIKPTWRAHRAREGDILIELDPGMSFGTGHHATTRFCLKMIERLSTTRNSFLDVGTGSGILAIGAAKIGCRPILAVDNDPQAVRIARANARMNGTRFPIRVASVEVLAASQLYDIVAANILADVILARRHTLASLVAPGGQLILAGILSREAAEVERAFTSLGFAPFDCETTRNWTGFVFHKAR